MAPDYDPAVVKVNERKKKKTVFNYPKAYLQLQLAGSDREKESMETKTTAFARQRELT